MKTEFPSPAGVAAGHTSVGTETRRATRRGDALLMVAAVTAAVLWFALLGHRDLMDPDEGRYARIPQEMLDTGDWVTPRLNGYKYFEKPPLQYWLTAASFAAFGQSNAAARLPLAVLGFAGALWVWFVGARVFGREAGLFAFLLSLGGFFYVTLGHLLSLDLPVSVFLTFGIGALLLAQTRRDEAKAVRNWMLLGWAALGLAVLAKGLIGLVLPAAALLLCSLWQRDWAIWRQLHLGKGLLVLLAVTAPWFVLVSLRNPEFPQFFFIHEHLARYTTDVHHRDEPWWYFLPWLLAGALPWAAQFLRALFQPGFAWMRGAGGFDPVRFLWVYAVFVLVFFSASHSMLPPYILPMFPALALLAGRQMAERPWIGSAAALAGLLGAAFLLSATGIGVFVSRSVPLGYLEAARPWLAGAGAVLVLAALAAWFRRGSTRDALLLLSLGALLGFQLVGWGAQAFSPSRSGRDLAAAVRPYLEQGAELFAVGSYVHSVSFYLDRSQTLVDYTGEMAFGISQAPDRPVLDWSAFSARWRAAERAVAVMEARSLPDVSRHGLAMRLIYADPRKVAIVKP